MTGSSPPRSPSRSSYDLIFVTGNSKKLEEVRKYLEINGFTGAKIESVSLDLPELQGDDCCEISAEKCKLAYEELKKTRTRPFLVFTEDTSLCYSALKELPGPYIKWFLQKLGHDGLNKLLAGYSDKTAYAQTIFALTGSASLRSASSLTEEVKTFVGRTKGKIVPARGCGNFGSALGWDPVFEPEESNGLTYGEMTAEAKNAISHRSRSLEKLLAFLKEMDNHTTGVVNTNTGSSRLGSNSPASKRQKASPKHSPKAAK